MSRTLSLHDVCCGVSIDLIILVIVILHNLPGYLCGYLTGTLFKMDLPGKKAVAIEIGMQNSGLAATLAGTAFPDLGNTK